MGRPKKIPFQADNQPPITQFLRRPPQRNNSSAVIPTVQPSVPAAVAGNLYSASNHHNRLAVPAAGTRNSTSSQAPPLRPSYSAATETSVERRTSTTVKRKKRKGVIYSDSEEDDNNPLDDQSVVLAASAVYVVDLCSSSGSSSPPLQPNLSTAGVDVPADHESEESNLDMSDIEDKSPDEKVLFLAKVCDISEEIARETLEACYWELERAVTWLMDITPILHVRDYGDDAPLLPHLEDEVNDVRLDLDAWVEGVGDVAGLSSSSGFPSPLMIPNMSAAGSLQLAPSISDQSYQDQIANLTLEVMDACNVDCRTANLALMHNRYNLERAVNELRSTSSLQVMFPIRPLGNLSATWPAISQNNFDLDACVEGLLQPIMPVMGIRPVLDLFGDDEEEEIADSVGVIENGSDDEDDDYDPDDEESDYSEDDSEEDESERVPDTPLKYSHHVGLDRNRKKLLNELQKKDAKGRPVESTNITRFLKRANYDPPVKKVLPFDKYRGYRIARGNGFRNADEHVASSWKSSFKKHNFQPNLLGGDPNAVYSQDVALNGKRKELIAWLKTCRKDRTRLNRMMRLSKSRRTNRTIYDCKIGYSFFESGKKRSFWKYLDNQWRSFQLDLVVYEKFHIVYIAGIVTNKKILPSPSGLSWDQIMSHPNTKIELYPGKFTSKGYLIMRFSHFQIGRDSVINRSLLANGEHKMCFEIVVIPCTEGCVAEAAESFIIKYGRFWNLKHPNSKTRFLITKPEVTCSKENEKIAEDCIRRKTGLFKFVTENSEVFPQPYPHLATMGELLQLPYKVNSSNIKERWIYSPPRAKNNWGKRILNPNVGQNGEL